MAEDPTIRRPKKLELDPETAALLEAARRRWAKLFEPELRALRESARITGADLAVRIIPVD